MKKTVFEGAGVAIVTPMNDDFSVNYEKFAELLEYQIANGTDAIIVCGTTGEASTLEDEEHTKVIEFAVKQVNGRVPVIAGTGSNETAYALKLSQDAEKAGADALLIVTPYYNKTSQRGLIAHYNYIADRVNIPIILYNVPGRTGVNIQPATYLELSKHPNIVATKEANGDVGALVETIALCGDNLQVYSGNDNQITSFMSLGAKGVISVLSNIMPRETHNIAAAALKGDFKESARLQIEYLEIANKMFVDVNPIPVKQAMNMMGLKVGPCRLPLIDMSDANVKIVEDVLKKYNLM